MRNYEITDEILKAALQFIENSTFEELLSLLPNENLKQETGGIGMSEHLQYPEMMADIELCHEQLSEICQDKHNKAVMSVPPRQTDFDIQLSAALDELKAYRKMGTVEQCKQLINAWNTRAAKAEQKQKELESIREIVMKKMTDIAFGEDDTCEKYCSDCPHRICGRKLEGLE